MQSRSNGRSSNLPAGFNPSKLKGYVGSLRDIMSNGNNRQSKKGTGARPATLGTLGARRNSAPNARTSQQRTSQQHQPQQQYTNLPPHMRQPNGRRSAPGNMTRTTVYRRAPPSNNGLRAMQTGISAADGRRNMQKSNVRVTNAPRMQVNTRPQATTLHPVGKNRNNRNSNYQNGMKRKPQMQNQPRKKRRMDQDVSVQHKCCIINCDEIPGSRLHHELKLLTEDSFRPSFIRSGWNRICDYHFFSDKMKYKKLHSEGDDKLSINTDDNKLGHSKRRFSGQLSDDDEYNSTARVPSRMHHVRRRATLGRINTNFSRKRTAARFETLAVSPEQDIASQKRIMAADEEEDDESSENELPNNTSATSTGSNPSQNDEEESFEMPPQSSHSLYHLHTPTTPNEDLIIMQDSNNNAPSTLQKFLQSRQHSVLTPRSPGDLPLELVSSSVSNSSLPQFTKLDTPVQSGDDEKRRRSHFLSPVFRLDDGDDDEHSSQDDIHVLENNRDTRWRHLDAYSSDEEDDISNSDHSHEEGKLSEEGDIFILSNGEESKTDTKKSKSKTASRNHRTKGKHARKYSEENIKKRNTPHGDEETSGLPFENDEESFDMGDEFSETRVVDMGMLIQGS